MTTAARMLIGWKEWVALPDLRLPAIKAKVDTGARTSALHAFELETFDRNGDLYVRFRVHPLRSRKLAANPVVVKCEARVVDHRFVSDSGGHRELRYVIETDLMIGGVRFPIEVTLANRETMAHRMLIGRSAMKQLMIEPSLSFLLGKPEKVMSLYADLARVSFIKKKKKKKKKKTKSNPALVTRTKIAPGGVSGKQE